MEGGVVGDGRKWAWRCSLVPKLPLGGAALSAANNFDSTASHTLPCSPSELTTTDDDDASLVGPLLDQIDRPLASVFADGAYNGEPVYRSVTGHTPDVAVIIPPRSTAVPSDTAETDPTQRDRHIQLIEKRGRLAWQRAVDYGKRSLAEVAMFRYKKVIGRGLHARTLPTQKTEAKVACKVINIMTGLGMPVSRRIA
jgi:hypothetical protein